MQTQMSIDITDRRPEIRQHNRGPGRSVVFMRLSKIAISLALLQLESHALILMRLLSKSHVLTPVPPPIFFKFSSPISSTLACHTAFHFPFNCTSYCFPLCSLAPGPPRTISLVIAWRGPISRNASLGGGNSRLILRVVVRTASFVLVSVN